MLRILLISILAFNVACSSAQQTMHSSKVKGAQRDMDNAMEQLKAPSKAVAAGDFSGPLSLAKQAVQKDPNFWEAHLLVADLSSDLRDFPTAITHYREAIRSNPNHFSTGSTYYILGKLEQNSADYESAIKTFNTYLSFKLANPEFVKEVTIRIKDCEFAAEAKKHPTEFSPINVGPGINTKDPEYFPSITVDGKTLLFTRLIEDKRVGADMGNKQEDFYVSNLSDRNAWETAFPMPTNINTIHNEGAPSISADGRSLIFVACSYPDDSNYGPGRTGKGSCDLFYAKRLGQRWTNPENLKGFVNTPSWESQPSLSADGKTMYFVRGVRGRAQQGDNDIFVSTLMEDGKWASPTRLPDIINTPQKEESVLIHPDGRTLYFASRGHQGFGGLDIFVSRMDPLGNWGKPVNLGYPINTEADENSLMVSADGEIAFFASDRKGGYGDLDIYYFVMPENLRPTKTLYFDGKVFDAVTKQPVPGKFTLIDIATGKEVVRSEADGLDGSFTVSLPIDREYVLKVSYPHYNNFSANFDMKNPDNQEVIHMDAPMVPLTKLDMEVTLKNVFFDLGKATLRPESNIELNGLKDFLIANSTIKIELQGHTDTRGDAAKNQLLSQNRAKAVYDYLITVGIDAKRLTFKGFGETMPIILDDVIAKLPSEKAKEKAHQENRRTAYKIIP